MNHYVEVKQIGEKELYQNIKIYQFSFSILWKWEKYMYKEIK